MRLRIRVSYLLAAALVIVSSTLVLWQPIDGIQGNVLSLVFGEDTKWAAGYTDRGFKTAQVGMKRDQIHALLGPPLGTQDFGEGITVDTWTLSPTDTNYRERAFVFDRDTATEKISGYWMD